eukprot:2592326-Amphidinium_carterae.1
MSIKEILQRPQLQPVHNLVQDRTIPPAVLCLLGKGYKFVPDLTEITFGDLREQGHMLQRQINSRAFFSMTEYFKPRLKKAKTNW